MDRNVKDCLADRDLLTKLKLSTLFASKKISNCLEGKENNFDFIRFIAALAVIFSHSYALTASAEEPVDSFSGGLCTIGGLSVMTFFVISGFLITRSFEKSKNIFEYFASRALRIYPALIFVTLCTVFLIGPLLTTHTLKYYFTNSNTIGYLLNIAVIRIHQDLPGVFEHNHFARIVNGSLWTLPHEILCYFLVAAAGLLFYRKMRQFFIISILIALIIFFNNFIFLKWKFYWDGIDFLWGALFYIYREKIKLNTVAAVACFILLVINIRYISNYYLSNFITGILISYIIIFLSFVKTKHIKNFAKKGDFSYGVYIWGFLVQQIIGLKFPGLNHYYNFLISASITLMFAVFSWHFIEKRALSFKHHLKKKKYRKIPSEKIVFEPKRIIVNAERN